MLAHQETELLPWHKTIYSQLCRLNSEQKLAHAYLFEGLSGLGKLSLAKHYTHYLLCQSPQQSQPCKKCRTCLLISAGTHPDLCLITPEETRYIKIEQIRKALSFMANTSLQGGRKIIIIAPAEAMNTNSANALLKALEEPADGTLLILVTSQPALLMPTIRSRCQSLKFNTPETSISTQWLQSKNITANALSLLKLANGAPLKALELADEDALHERTVLHETLIGLLKGEVSISQAALSCNAFSISDNIEGMMLCVGDLLDYIQSNHQQELQDHDLKLLSEILKDKENAKELHLFYSELLLARKAILSSANPNPQLILESLFYKWLALSK